MQKDWNREKTQFFFPWLSHFSLLHQKLLVYGTFLLACLGSYFYLLHRHLSFFFPPDNSKNQPAYFFSPRPRFSPTTHNNPVRWVDLWVKSWKVFILH